MLDQIRQRYAGKSGQEWDRLGSTPITRVEYLITSHCLDKYLPRSGLLLDAGSGPGRYAIDLARKEYRVVMYDLLLDMLRLGQEKAAEAGVSHRIMLVDGDLVALPYQDNRFDAVISLGAPLSHVTDAQARSRAVAEMARVVRPGGVVFLTGLARLAGYRSSVFWFQHHPEFFGKIMTAENRSRGIIDGSQVWYNFASGELEELAQSVGLQVMDRVGCEGLANHLPFENLEQLEAHPRYGPAWKEILLETCNDPSIVGISNHLLVVVRKR